MAQHAAELAKEINAVCRDAELTEIQLEYDATVCKCCVKVRLVRTAYFLISRESNLLCTHAERRTPAHVSAHDDRARS